MSKLLKMCKQCLLEFETPGEHWYIKSTNKKSGKISYSCKIYEKNKAKKQDKERKSLNFKQWYAENKEYRNEYRNKLRSSKIDHYRELARIRGRRLRQDLNYRLQFNLRTRTSMVISGKTKSGSAVTDLGCSIEELRSHLESKFSAGMSWDNYGMWHIDHIQPLSSFNLSDRAEFLKAAHYLNLQPLWAADNIRKGNRL